MEKQQATNVFLGWFLPKENQPNIWDLATDFYLHNKEANGVPVERRRYMNDFSANLNNEITFDNWAVTCDFQQCGILMSVDEAV